MTLHEVCGSLLPPQAPLHLVLRHSHCASAMRGQFPPPHSVSARGGLVWEGYLAPAPSVKCCRISTVTCYTQWGITSRVRLPCCMWEQGAGITETGCGNLPE